MRRREFLGTCATLSGLGAAAGGLEASPLSSGNASYGVLVDVDKCIGCRKCEWACNQVNSLPVQPLETFEDKSVFVAERRPDAGNYTVVNQVPSSDREAKPVWVKIQCMHCEVPACSSACLVTALEKQANGAVTYDSWRCMGCRYCMVACPFQIPAYEYADAFSPEVRKCTLCFERISKAGGVPACVEICPPQCLVFARRDKLLDLARRKIAAPQSNYLNHIYGEHEVGGTAWLYVSSRPMEELGLPVLGSKPPSQLTETIQHGVFKGFLAPVALFGFLAGIMRLFRPKEDES